MQVSRYLTLGHRVNLRGWCPECAGQAAAANQPALHRFSGELIFPNLYRIAMTSRQVSDST
jgi:hypothetical protein